MALVNITTDKEFKDKVLDSKKPVLVDFWAAWCPPCRAMAPILHDIADELGDKADIIKVNIEESDYNGHLAEDHMVRGIPTMVVYKDGKEVDRVVGMADKASLLKKLA